jgi:hypothetical protein
MNTETVYTLTKSQLKKIFVDGWRDYALNPDEFESLDDVLDGYDLDQFTPVKQDQPKQDVTDTNVGDIEPVGNTEQLEAVAFGEWIKENGFSSNREEWLNPEYKQDGATTQELYKMFKESK